MNFTFRFTAFVTVCLIAGCYPIICFGEGPSAALPFTVSKETTAIVQPLKPDGTIDYVAAINQVLGQGVTPENNGYVVWLSVSGTDILSTSIRSQTLALLGVDPQTVPERGMDLNGPDEFPMTPWKTAEKPAVANYLTANEKFLNLAVGASQKSQWWDTAVSTNGSLIGVLLPSLNTLRSVSLALCARALLRQGEGNFDGFLSDVTAVKRLSRLAAGWTMVSRLVCTGIDRSANATIALVVANGSLSASQCARLAETLDHLAPIPDLVDVMNGAERWEQLDFVTLLATGKIKEKDFNFIPNIDVLMKVELSAVDWDNVLRQINQREDRIVVIIQNQKHLDARAVQQALIAEAAQVSKRQSAAKSLEKKPGETRGAYSVRVADAITLAMSPSTAKPEMTSWQIRIDDEILRTLVAAGAYHADESHWPAELSNLVPKYLNAVPRDLFSRGTADPVRYLQGDAGIFIYSVGLNQTDDGGLSDAAKKQDDRGLGIAPVAGSQGL